MSILHAPAHTATPAVETDREFFERFGHELDAVEARGGLLTKLVPAESFTDDLVNAVACTECRDDSDIPTPDDDPAWDDVWSIEEVEPLTPADLVKGITFYPLETPARRADADETASAYEAGFGLGTDGWNVRNVAPASHFTAAEANAFMAGIIDGESKLWNEYARDMEELDRMAGVPVDPFTDLHDGELMEARMMRPVMA